MYPQTQGSTQSASLAGSSRLPADLPAVSEIERESGAVEAQLGYLEERLQVLERRLMPVLLSPPDTSEATKGMPSPSSQIGSQLRCYSNRVESAASRISDLLNQLALP